VTTVTHAADKNRGCKRRKPTQEGTHRLPASSTRLTLVAATGSMTATQRQRAIRVLPRRVNL
jgi:hypothetical protein